MRVAVIEDEPINAQELISLINQYDSEISIDSVLDTVETTVDYLQSDQPDLLFLDIELADGNAFEIFKQVTVKCPIVFTTAYDQFMLKSFEENSISYLLKPITFEKLEKVFEKYSTLKRILKTDVEQILELKPTYKENFLIRSGNKLVPLNISKIAYFYSADNICYITSVEQQKYLSSNNLYELEEMLDPNSFFRINRQYIVSREIISHLEPYIKGQVKLHFKGELNEPAIISRQKTSLLKEWLS